MINRSVISRSFLGAAVTATALSLPALPAFAADVPVDAKSVSTRIDLAGRQRMLSERMAKFFCFARSGVDAATNVKKFVDSRELFVSTHAGFADGSVEMGLFAEANGSVKASWQQVDLMWLSLNNIYDRALGGELVSEKDFDYSMRLTLEVRKRANDMVAQMRSAYASKLGDGGFGDALLLDLYGRQRMLSQKLSKEVCLVARGHDLDKTQPELQATLELFETSLAAFMEGMPIAGVPKPPSDAIAAQLQKANAEWQPIRLVAATVASGNAVTLTDLQTFAEGADRFLVEMNKAVKMLAAHENENS